MYYSLRTILSLVHFYKVGDSHEKKKSLNKKFNPEITQAFENEKNLYKHNRDYKEIYRKLLEAQSDKKNRIANSVEAEQNSNTHDYPITLYNLSSYKNLFLLTLLLLHHIQPVYSHTMNRPRADDAHDEALIRDMTIRVNRANEPANIHSGDRPIHAHEFGHAWAAVDQFFTTVKSGDEQKAMRFFKENPAVMSDYLFFFELIARGYTQACQYLINKGINIDFVDTKLKASPLEMAVVSEKSDIVDLLLIHKADVNLINTRNYNSTALHTACRGNKAAIVSKLIKAGANINAINQLMETPLGIATNAGSIEIARLLLQHGADMNINGIEKLIENELLPIETTLDVLINSKFPLQKAIDNKNDGMVELLLKFGASTAMLYYHDISNIEIPDDIQQLLKNYKHSDLAEDIIPGLVKKQGPLPPEFGKELSQDFFNLPADERITLGATILLLDPSLKGSEFSLYIYNIAMFYYKEYSKDNLSSAERLIHYEKIMKWVEEGILRGSAVSHFLKARLLRTLKQPAIEEIREVIKLLKIAADHNNFQGLLELGDVYYELDRLDLAEKYFIKALNMHPAHPGLLENLCDVYRAKGDIKLAERYQLFARRIQKTTNSQREKEGNATTANNTLVAVSEFTLGIGGFLFYRQQKQKAIAQAKRCQEFCSLLNVVTDAYYQSPWYYADKTQIFYLNLQLKDADELSSKRIYQGSSVDSAMLAKFTKVTIDPDSITSQLQQVLKDYQLTREHDKNLLGIKLCNLSFFDAKKAERYKNALKANLFESSAEYSLYPLCLETMAELNKIKSRITKLLEALYSAKDRNLSLNKEIQDVESYLESIRMLEETKVWKKPEAEKINKAIALVKNYRGNLFQKIENPQSRVQTAEEEIDQLYMLLNKLPELSVSIEQQPRLQEINQQLPLLQQCLRNVSVPVEVYLDQFDSIYKQITENATATQLANILEHIGHINDEDLNLKLRKIQEEYRDQMKQQSTLKEEKRAKRLQISTTETISFALKHNLKARAEGATSESASTSSKGERAQKKEEKEQKERYIGPESAHVSRIEDLKKLLAIMEKWLELNKNPDKFDRLLLTGYLVNFLELARYWEGNFVTRKLKNHLLHYYDSIDPSLLIELAVNIYRPTILAIRTPIKEKLDEMDGNTLDTKLTTSFNEGLKSLQHTGLYRKYIAGAAPEPVNLIGCLNSLILLLEDLSQLGKRLEKEETDIKQQYTIHCALTLLAFVGERMQLLNDLAQASLASYLVKSDLQSNHLLKPFFKLCMHARNSLSHSNKLGLWELAHKDELIACLQNTVELLKCAHHIIGPYLANQEHLGCEVKQDRCNLGLQ